MKLLNDLANKYDEIDDLLCADICIEPSHNASKIPHEIIKIMNKKDVSLLTAWRIFRGLTQQDVAKITGMSQPQIAQAEKTQKPHNATLERLAKAYNCSAHQLII